VWGLVEKEQLPASLSFVNTQQNFRMLVVLAAAIALSLCAGSSVRRGRCTIDVRDASTLSLAEFKQL
jgi:hypothetical protein